VAGTTWTCVATSAAHTSTNAVTHVLTTAGLGNFVDGKIATQAAADSSAYAPIDTGAQVLVFVPSGNLDTATAAPQTTWITIGNITVPTWATKCQVVYTINGVYAVATGVNTSVQIKVGAIGGAINGRIIDPGNTTQRFGWAICDKLSALTSGVKSVTLATLWNAGTVTSYRADTSTSITAQFTFQP